VEEIVGTINYYSPELLGYIQEAGVAPGELGVASDVFALGLIYTEYLTGAPPPFDVATYHEPAVAVRSGVALRVPRERVDPVLADLVDRMLAADPAARPSIGDIHATLMSIRAPEGAPPRPRPIAPPPVPAAPTSLRGKGLRTALRRPPAPAAPPSSGGGRLLGKLLHRRSGDGGTP
jgi:serine/threonine protein kinase